MSNNIRVFTSIYIYSYLDRQFHKHLTGSKLLVPNIQQTQSENKKFPSFNQNQTSKKAVTIQKPKITEHGGDQPLQTALAVKQCRKKWGQTVASVVETGAIREDSSGDDLARKQRPGDRQIAEIEEKDDHLQKAEPKNQ